MYSLHIANKNYSSWSLRPWVLMRALGIPFNEVLHPFADAGNREEFRRFSPTAKVPCLVDGQQTVWDSLAITEYLAETHPQVWPRETAARAWARCASAEMHSGFGALRSECSMSCGQRIQLHRSSEALRQDLARIDELWCEGLRRFGGPFSGGLAVHCRRRLLCAGGFSRAVVSVVTVSTGRGLPATHDRVARNARMVRCGARRDLAGGIPRAGYRRLGNDNR